MFQWHKKATDFRTNPWITSNKLRSTLNQHISTVPSLRSGIIQISNMSCRPHRINCITNILLPRAQLDSQLLTRSTRGSSQRQQQAPTRFRCRRNSVRTDILSSRTTLMCIKMEKMLYNSRSPRMKITQFSSNWWHRTTKTPGRMTRKPLLTRSRSLRMWIKM